MTFFKTSSNPLLSVIIPSRERTKELIETINSFIQLANNPNDVEFLIKLDTDDESMIHNINLFPGNTKVLVADRKNGYHDLHLFVNDLCKLSNGDWILLMNDDAKMVTKDWDLELKNINPYEYNAGFQGNEQVCLINPGSPEKSTTEVFPIIRRGGYEKLKHFSLHPHNDTWVQEVYEPLNARIFFPKILIKHFNNEVTDATRLHSAKAQETSFKNWDDYLELRQKDTAKLKELL